MAKYDAQLTEIKNQLALAKSVLVVLPQNLTADKLAAGLSLMLALKQSGKEVVVLSAGTPLVSHTNLFGVGEVKSELPQSGAGGDFVITLEGVVQGGVVSALEKLDWSPEGNNLNLVFHTLPGKKFEPYNISHKYQGGGFSPNLIFVLGASILADLGQVEGQIFQFAGVPLVSVAGGNFGSVSVGDPQVGSVSEMVYQVLGGLGLGLDQDVAQNLVTGIYDATENLTKGVGADTFIALGQLMQMGAQVPGGQPAQMVSQVQTQPVQAQPVQPVEAQSVQNVQPQPVPVEAQSALQPVSTPAFQSPFIQPVVPQESIQGSGFDLNKVLNIPPLPDNQAVQANSQPPVSQPTQETPVGEAAANQNADVQDAKPAPDWLTPKIFKGGSLG